MHFRRSMLAGGSALAAVAVLALGGAGAASAGTHPGAASQAAAARAALHGLRVPGTQHRLAGAQRVKGLTKVSSTNWSGYADTGTAYSKVSSSWTQPAVTCSGTATQLAAFWVGIDGYSSGTVEQDGTLAECYEGTAYYYTWWEMYPSNDIQTVGDTVKPGDKIAASVVRTGTKYALKVTDSTTTGNSFSKTRNLRGRHLRGFQRRVDRGGAQRLGRPLPAGEVRQVDRRLGCGIDHRQVGQHQDLHRRRDHHGELHRHHGHAERTQLGRHQLQRYLGPQLLRPPVLRSRAGGTAACRRASC